MMEHLSREEEITKQNHYFSLSSRNKLDQPHCDLGAVDSSLLPASFASDLVQGVSFKFISDNVFELSY